MPVVDRRNTGIFGQWWWTIDRYLLVAIGAIMAVGIILVMAASPPVAERIGLHSFYFVHRQLVFLSLAVFLIITISMMPPVAIRRFAVLGFLASLILLIAVPVIGVEVKGAQRWIALPGFSMQPSEFMKPFFVVVIAWVLARKDMQDHFPGYRIAMGLYALVAGLLVIQPDIGMTMIVSAVWGAQLFLAGLPVMWILMAGISGISGIIFAYIYFPHVAHRINNFLDPAAGDNYQNMKSIQAFVSGGFLGQGPGEGIVKDRLPDSHTDFIFAVAGEELGVIVTIGIVALFAFVVIRGFMHLFKESDLFIVYAASGLLILFGLQTLINMGVSLNLLPNTGMTLPFVSYGGSSTLATAISAGMILGLTRKRYGESVQKRRAKKK